MTAWPNEQNAHHWWLQVVFGRTVALHAVPGDLRAGLTHEQVWQRIGDAIDEGVGITATARCGRLQVWTYPGVLSRLGNPRCRQCCRKVGIQPGKGTPCNEASAREAG